MTDSIAKIKRQNHLKEYRELEIEFSNYLKAYYFEETQREQSELLASEKERSRGHRWPEFTPQQTTAKPTVRIDHISNKDALVIEAPKSVADYPNSLLGNALKRAANVLLNRAATLLAGRPTLQPVQQAIIQGLHPAQFVPAFMQLLPQPVHQLGSNPAVVTGYRAPEVTFDDDHPTPTEFAEHMQDLRDSAPAPVYEIEAHPELLDEPEHFERVVEHTTHEAIARQVLHHIARQLPTARDEYTDFHHSLIGDTCRVVDRTGLHQAAQAMFADGFREQLQDMIRDNLRQHRDSRYVESSFLGSRAGLSLCGPLNLFPELRFQQRRRNTDNADPYAGFRRVFRMPG